MVVTKANNNGVPQYSHKPSIACPICCCCTSSANEGSGGKSAHPSFGTTVHLRATSNLQKVGGLDASFVNIPHSHYPSLAVGVGSGGSSDASKFSRNVHDIESILASCQEEGGVGNHISRRDVVSGVDMQDSSTRMDAYFEAASAILTGESSMSEEGGTTNQTVYCHACLDRIGRAIESCSDRLDEECIAYGKAASSEEERTSLLNNVLSTNTDTSFALDDNHHVEEDSAISRAIESFQYEIDNLSNACDEQEKELRMLQDLMQNQIDRSNAISDQEDIVHHELNSLEIDANNFGGEESRIVSSNCSAVENEINAISRVKLMSIPFKIRINIDLDSDNNQEGGGPGCYPTINNLRLAYRVNEKAGLRWDEINAAFFNAAQLMAFTLGLYPGHVITSTIRIIPIHPCAKILVNLPEGQSVHNLGFDGQADSQSTRHIPPRSITLFLVLLNQLSSHILTETNQRAVEPPPFHMTEVSIDNVDVTKLSNSDTRWASVVFCIAANLRWLSELEIGHTLV